MVEGARLESVYTPKGYRGFESLPLCKRKPATFVAGFLFLKQTKLVSVCGRNKKAKRNEVTLWFFMLAPDINSGSPSGAR